MFIENLNGIVQRISYMNLQQNIQLCIHIRIFYIVFAFDSDSLPFSSQDIGYGAAVFHVCKICAFNQSNALVLIVKCKIFF